MPGDIDIRVWQDTQTGDHHTSGWVEGETIAIFLWRDKERT
jgi:hypothetical protein